VFAYEITPTSLRLKKAQGRSNVNSMWGVFFFSFPIEGIVHKEFVPPGQTVNGKFYRNMLMQLDNIRRELSDIWRKNSWALHYDNAPAHVLLVVQQFLASTNTTVIPHPLNSLDLTPCGNPAGIIASMQKGTISKGMEANRNFSKWLSCSRRILGTLG